MYKDESVLAADPETETLIQTDYATDRNKPMPNILHGVIQTNLGFILKSKYDHRYILASEVTLDLSPRATPDLLIFEKRLLDWHLVEPRETIMPITTVEIVSPSQSASEMAKKIHTQYFPAGIQSAWLVELPPFKCIRVITPTQTLYFDKGILTDPITGIEIPVEEVFEGML